jgi:hypothetical protein
MTIIENRTNDLTLPIIIIIIGAVKLLGKLLNKSMYPKYPCIVVSSYFSPEEPLPKIFRGVTM